MELEKDLASRQEARTLASQAAKAQEHLASMCQEQLDAIVSAVSRAFLKEARTLAQMAVEETGFGNVKDKTEKNRFAAENVGKAMEGMKAVGILQEQKDRGLTEIGVPVGVIAGIVPSTNPTSTVCYKAMIALKSGNAIVFSPHPAAAKCTLQAVRTAAAAAENAGCPKGAVSCLTMPTMDACDELMKNPHVRLILATGGPNMVKAAYSSGTPAIGVGAGNGPAYIHRSADIPKAVERIFASKTFDNGTVCASEQSIILEKNTSQQVRTACARMGGYFLDPGEAKKVAAILFRANGAMNTKVVGRTAKQIAQMAGISVPEDTRVLLAAETGVGDGHPYSNEKLCPVLGFFEEADEAGVLARSLEILRHEGRGHTFAIHAKDEAVIRRFALAIPVSRFLVNTPAAQGGVGLSTGLFPALTLGCGAVGGSSSSNNIGPMDLVNIRRVAHGLRDVDLEEKAPNVEISQDMLSALAEAILKKLQ